MRTPLNHTGRSLTQMESGTTTSKTLTARLDGVTPARVKPGRAGGTRTPLDEYFAELAMLGFERRWIRTDYELDSLEQAVEICGPFFGADLGARIREHSRRVVPECTAIYSQRHP